MEIVRYKSHSFLLIIIRYKGVSYVKKQLWVRFMLGLIDNNALITKVVKGNTVVLIDKDEYTSKVNKFIVNNNNNTVHAAYCDHG